jgi:hypothetical protein
MREIVPKISYVNSIGTISVLTVGAGRIGTLVGYAPYNDLAEIKI